MNYQTTLYLTNENINVRMKSVIKIWVVLILVLLIGCSEKTYDEYISEANQQITTNNTAKAIISLKNAIQISPKSPLARFMLGQLYFHEYQYKNAEKELNKALVLKHPANQVIPLLSKIYHKTNDDLALLSLEHKYTQLSIEQKAEIGFHKAQAHLRLQQEKEAIKLLKKISQYKTTSPFKTLANSYVLSTNKNFDNALAQIDFLLEKFPTQADALKLKGMLLLKKDQKSAAVKIYQQYLKAYPEDRASQLFLARLLTVMNRTKEAEPIVDGLLEIYNTHALLNQLKAVARYHAKDNTSALAYSEKAILKNPREPVLRLIAGYSAYQLKNCNTAYNHLSIIADKLAYDHPALRLLAICQVNLGFGIAASNTLSLINEASPPDAELFSMVSFALINQGEIVKAKEVLNASPLEGNSEDLMLLGIMKLSMNEVSDTINLELAHQQTPSNSLTKQTLATAYLQTQQFEQALTLAEGWKKENSKDSQAYLVSGLAYVKLLDYAKAKLEFQQLVAIAPENLKAQLLLIDVLDKLGEYSKARTDLNQLLKTHPFYVPALVKLYLFSANKNEVISLMQSKLKSVPENTELILALAKIQLAEAQPQESVSLLLPIAEHSNKSDAYWDILGQAYMQLHQYNQAKKHYKLWLQEKPHNTFALIGNLVLMDLFHQYNEAVLLTSNYLKKAGRDSRLELLHIHFLIKVSDFDTAKLSYAQLAQTLLDLPFTKGLAGQIQMHDKNYSDALANLFIAYEHFPNTQNVQLIYQCYYGLEQATKSYAFLKKHVEMHPNDLESLLQLAALQVNINIDESIHNYEKALKINSNNFIALNNLASFYLDKGQVERAQEFAEKALKLQPSNSYVLDTLGQILLAKKEYHQALTYFSKAVSDKNVIDGIYVNYIEALFLTQQHALANRKIEQRKITSGKALEKLLSLKKKYKT